MGREDKDIKLIFAEALGKGTAEERRSYLDKACQGDSELRSEAESLLQMHDGAGDFMETPVIEADRGGSYAAPEATQATRVEAEDAVTLVEETAAEGEAIIEGYKVLEELSRGGQAIVYKAIQKATNRMVAVKVLQGLQLTGRSQFRFEREVDLVANMQHNNIVTIFDSGIAQGQYYYAMEYIVGHPLDAYIKMHELSIRKIMALFKKVCAAIAYAHQRGVIHRDLKPDNILVDGGGEPHILDFGVAKLTDSTDDGDQKGMQTYAGQIIGTLAFMSPEQASGKPNAVDVRTDVYSLGVMLYRVLTDAFPYEVDGPMLGVLNNIQKSEPTRPSRIVRHINSEVEAILLKALDKSPGRRYQSAAELQGDIEHWLEGKPVMARSDSSTYVLRKLITRNYYTSTVVVMLIIIVFGFSAFSFSVLRRDSELQRNFNNVRQSLEEKEGQVLFYGERAAFLYFLRGWHMDLLSDSVGVFPDDSREMRAVRFLLDSRPLEEKEAGFRNQMPSAEATFTDFVVAEYYFKSKDADKATGAYQQLLQTGDFTSDEWLLREIRLRLRELELRKKQESETS